MAEAKSNDGSTERLLIKGENEGEGSDDELNAFVSGKWNKNGIVRTNRSCEEATSLSSIVAPLRLVTQNRRRLFILTALIAILFIVNSVSITHNNSPQNQIIVNHRSHVPGMKENEKQTARSLKIINVRTTSISSNTRVSTSLHLSNTNHSLKPPPGYLVWSDQCKIPDLDPFADDVMRFFKRQKYEPCSALEPLSRVSYDSNRKRYTLHIENQLKRNYAKSGSIECCYQLVRRSGEDKRADEEYSLDKCVKIVAPQTELAEEYENILVKCKNFDKQVYINAHAMISERPGIRQRLDEWKEVTPENARPLSVLMIGIDSVSRQNFIRAMPKTAQFVYDSEWFEMSGYNKMEDNTFPNLMAIFTGYNLTTANTICNPYVVGYLDKCPLIWHEYQRHGYVTVYAEDEETISTFNYLKVGFQKPPTDYYLRPLMLAAEDNLSIKQKSGLIFCLGFKHSAEYVYDYVTDLVTTYKNESYFGIFWANTFSHNALSDASVMDQKVLDYLKNFRDIGVLDESAIIFFSDHGMRFGPTRQLPSGRSEERLPFFFIWLPPWFKKRYPEFVNALNINKNRLTTPYDVHMTLKHILELSGRTGRLPGSQDCPECQSLFKPIPYNRSCSDAAIEEHWCTCRPYDKTDSKTEKVLKAANFIVESINDFLHTYKNGTVAKDCAKLRLSRVKYAYRAIFKSGEDEAYQIALETKPGNAVFESTVHSFISSGKFSLSGSISRLNSYAHMSSCVSEGVLQKLCFCT